jgi:nitrogen fixation/metabolism regulation signal transduction histidine kinase
LSRSGHYSETILEKASRDIALTRVLTQLRLVRSEREEQGRYFQTLIAHVPVALVSTDERGGVKLLNMAARRLFGAALAETTQFARHGEAFAVGMESIRPGTAVADVTEIADRIFSHRSRELS